MNIDLVLFNPDDASISMFQNWPLSDDSLFHVFRESVKVFFHTLYYDVKCIFHPLALGFSNEGEYHGDR